MRPPNSGETPLDDALQPRHLREIVAQARAQAEIAVQDRVDDGLVQHGQHAHAQVVVQLQPLVDGLDECVRDRQPERRTGRDRKPKGVKQPSELQQGLSQTLLDAIDDRRPQRTRQRLFRGAIPQRNAGMPAGAGTIHAGHSEQGLELRHRENALDLLLRTDQREAGLPLPASSLAISSMPSPAESTKSSRDRSRTIFAPVLRIARVSISRNAA
jgi:hypothetical protein